VSFQRTRTWQGSRDPEKDAELDRIEKVTSNFPNRCFAFNQFGSLSVPDIVGASQAQDTSVSLTR
jgi:hypothetical protein